MVHSSLEEVSTIVLTIVFKTQWSTLLLVMICYGNSLPSFVAIDPHLQRSWNPQTFTWWPHVTPIWFEPATLDWQWELAQPIVKASDTVRDVCFSVFMFACRWSKSLSVGQYCINFHLCHLLMGLVNIYCSVQNGKLDLLIDYFLAFCFIRHIHSLCYNICLLSINTLWAFVKFTMAQPQTICKSNTQAFTTVKCAVWNLILHLYISFGWCVCELIINPS